MRIDPHVHCRDGRQNYKETIEHVLRLCDEQGVDMVFDMPNTDPPLLTPDDAAKRLAMVPSQARGRYKLYLGLTADPEQIRLAAQAVSDVPEVIGLKLFAGTSVGNLAVTDEKDHARVYNILAEVGYKGVLAVHCEKESLFVPVFNPEIPVSHAAARPAGAETASVKDQIMFAKNAGFEGTLHICHISTPGALEAIAAARPEIKITCGVTPHHLLWTSARMQGNTGLLYKTNPPLRDAAINASLRAALKEGKTSWIESDHAPHAVCEKLFPPYLSGFPSLCLYKSLVEEILPSWDIPEYQIKNLTYANITAAFGERKLNET